MERQRQAHVDVVASSGACIFIICAPEFLLKH